MRPSLRAKVTLTISLFLLAVFSLSMYLTLTRNISQLHSNLNEQSRSFASLATPPVGSTFVLYQDSGSIKITQQVDKLLALDPDVTAISIVSVDGKQVYSSQSGAKLEVGSDQASSFNAQYVKNSSGYVSEIVQPFFEDSGAHRYSVVYKISTKRIEQNVAQAVRLILYVGVAILLLSIIAASWALNVLFVKPLRVVSRSADAISAGDYNQQIISNNKDEIGKLAHAVNSMANALKSDIVKLQEVDKLKTEFMMIASHNLRTPLSIMRGYIEMAEHAETVDELRAIIKTVQESMVRLHLLSEDLLTISSLEAGDQKVAKEPAEARQFIESVVSEFELLATKKKLRWQFTNDVPESAKIDLNQANMRSALGNLIDNAIKFTNEGGSVHVAAKTADNHLVFTVGDTGIGIAAEEIPKLFTKFHRGTSMMHYDYEGVGVGLYLTKLIVTEHGGQVAVKSEAGKGSTFTVYVPLPVSAPTSSQPVLAGHHPAP